MGALCALLYLIYSFIWRQQTEKEIKSATEKHSEHKNKSKIIAQETKKDIINNNDHVHQIFEEPERRSILKYFKSHQFEAKEI